MYALCLMKNIPVFVYGIRHMHVDVKPSNVASLDQIQELLVLISIHSRKVSISTEKIIMSYQRLANAMNPSWYRFFMMNIHGVSVLSRRYMVPYAATSTYHLCHEIEPI